MEDRRRKKVKAGQDSLLHLGRHGSNGVGKKPRAVGGNLKSDSDVDDDEDEQNKRFIICESAAAIPMFSIHCVFMRIYLPTFVCIRLQPLFSFSFPENCRDIVV